MTRRRSFVRRAGEAIASTARTPADRSQHRRRDVSPSRRHPAGDRSWPPSRVPALGVAHVAERLSLIGSASCLAAVGSIRPRHQTLRAALDWRTTPLLSAVRAGAARAGWPSSVGGRTLDGRRGIGAPWEYEPATSVSVLESLTGLVDKSLVLVQDGTGSPTATGSSRPSGSTPSSGSWKPLPRRTAGQGPPGARIAHRSGERGGRCTRLGVRYPGDVVADPARAWRTFRASAAWLLDRGTVRRRVWISAWRHGRFLAWPGFPAGR